MQAKVAVEDVYNSVDGSAYPQVRILAYKEGPFEREGGLGPFAAQVKFGSQSSAICSPLLPSRPDVWNWLRENLGGVKLKPVGDSFTLPFDLMDDATQRQG